MLYKLKGLIPQKLKNSYHLVQAIVANVWFGFPTRKLKVIGITGTDGKTTTCQMATAILEAAGKKVALASTINFRINGQTEANLSHYTTASAWAVQKFAAQAVKTGAEYLILETSSHALDQHRVWGVDYQIAVITNITREHLDYHKTLENYRKAKLKLFRMVAQKAQANKVPTTLIVNAEMIQPEQFLDFQVQKKFLYTTRLLQPGRAFLEEVESVEAEAIELGVNFSKFKLKNIEFKLKIPGKFNIENALAAVCVGLAEKIELETCAGALAQIGGVPGRMERVPNQKGLEIMVDFALTPEALEKLYAFLAEAKSKQANKIIAVFGSCGERDRGKRPLMGAVVSKYADQIILTDDEPYHEDPVRIIAEIAAGIKNKTLDKNLWQIPDRRAAIAKALQLGAAGDIVVVTGMGNFETRIVGNQKIPWNDRKVIEEELEKL